MTNKEAIEIIKSECYVFNPLNFDRSTMVNTALDMAVKALKQESCDDAVSRSDVISLIMNTNLKHISFTRGIRQKAFEDLLNGTQSLPSVKSQQRTGHWNVVSDGYGDNAYICECSECKDTVWVYKDADRKWNYCPSCGARMESEE